GHVGHFGGCVTVNWHDRSIAPERLWGRFYEELVDHLVNQGAWFSTAADAVAWFRKRRSAVFENISWDAGMLRVKISLQENGRVPSLQIRVHRPGAPARGIVPAARRAAI